MHWFWWLIIAIEFLQFLAIALLYLRFRKSEKQQRSKESVNRWFRRY